MKAVVLNETADNWLEAIVSHYQFQPYWWMRQVDAASRQALMRRHLQQLREDETAVIIGAFANDAFELTGFAALHPLAWDTEHFGVNVWRMTHLGVWGGPAQQRETACVLAQAAARETLRRRGKTIHIWTPLDAICVLHALEATGFRTMESQVYWLFNLRRQPLPPQQTAAVFRPHQPTDAPALASLAERVYSPIPNRFYADPHLPTAACDALYAKWLRNSCSGDVADYISVIEVDRQVAGYGTLRYLDDQDGLCNVRMGQFLLGAIDPAFRQRGLYDDMMRSLLAWLIAQEADIAFVGTQTNNAAAQTGMVRMGFRPVCGGLSLHLWFER
ncbi:MAG: GNAT family N-acetyltransferase [Chloroflexi bacterium]|nr:GNAT family N-acetyltransferase [Chloroflexota bacterium]